jgi:hypothetical protein
LRAFNKPDLSDIENEVPFSHGEMREELVAQAFAAYLMGPRAFDNRESSEGEFRNGPHHPVDGRLSWQLDNSNDFWLHFEPNGRARLDHRYDSGRDVCLAMIRLFNLQYPPKGSRAAA